MNVPIIGQPTVEEWAVVICIKCPCGQQLLLTGKPGAVAPCFKCGSAYQLGDMPTLSPLGVIQVPLNVGRLGKEPPA